MSLLTPLYVLGLLAVSLPLVFHLIRRMPRGELPFSSLMFLRPSPPRLTRRSRLDHLLLLLLRAAALTLIAIAFARPFLRQAALSYVDDVGRRKVAILVDASASMRRADLWQQATAKVEEVLGGLRPGDDVALLTFGRHVDVLIAFDDLRPTDPKQQTARVRSALEAVAPTWAASDLDQALIAAAEELNRAGDPANSTAAATRQIVLVSDLQQGCRIDSLQTYEWPDDVQLAVHTVAPTGRTNAGLCLASERSGALQADHRQIVRVRVTNDRDSQREQFELRWADGQGGASAGEPIGVYVPPGESRIVGAARDAENLGANRLLLSGDDQPFDNTLYLVPLRQDEVSLLYLGNDDQRDTEGMCYYLQRAFPETPRRKVTVTAHKPHDPLPADLSATRLIVVADAVSDERAAQLRQYVAEGGTVLYVLGSAAAGGALGRMMGRPDLEVEEGQADDYAMLGELDFGHPLFAPFAHPRFNDFTKIRFWKHRRVHVEGVPAVQVLARFDNGDPALFEQAHEQGRLLVLCSGWHPADSQLARSTKFVPLLCGVLRRAGVADPVLPQYEIGDPVVLAMSGQEAGDRSVRAPDLSTRKLAADARSFTETDQPGVYRLLAGDGQRSFAVNLAAAESKTAPMAVEQLERFGVRLGDRRTQLELAERRRQMRDLELEGKQKLWHRLIVAALGILIVETWLAGRLGRRAAEPAGVAG